MRFKDIFAFGLLAVLSTPPVLQKVHAIPQTAGREAAPIDTFQLADQFGQVHTLSLPGTNVTVITVADRKGSEQVDGWVKALKERYLGRIEIHGIADLSAISPKYRDYALKSFKKRHTHPVMIDWEGAVVHRLACRKDTANILVVDREGRVLRRFQGAIREDARQELFGTLDQAVDGLTK